MKIAIDSAVMAKMRDANATLLYMYIWHKCGKSEAAEIPIAYAEIDAEIGIAPKLAMRVVKNLEAMGIISKRVKKHIGTPTLHYHVLLSPDKMVVMDITCEYVYLFHDRHEGIYKIGKSKQPLVRAQSISSRLDRPVDVICSIPTRDSRRVEMAIHKALAARRIYGEWFDLGLNTDKAVGMFTAAHDNAIEEAARG